MGDNRHPPVSIDIIDMTRERESREGSATARASGPEMYPYVTAVAS